jgi:hypothetical protein
MGEKLSTRELDPRERKGWEGVFAGVKKVVSKSGPGKFIPTIYLGDRNNPMTPRLILDLVFTDSRGRPEDISLTFFNTENSPMVGHASGRAQWDGDKPRITKVEHFFAKDQFSQADLKDALEAITQAMPELDTNGLLRMN